VTSCEQSTLGNVCQILKTKTMKTMKTIKYIIAVILFQGMIFSCNPVAIDEDTNPKIHATGDQIDDPADPTEEN